MSYPAAFADLSDEGIAALSEYQVQTEERAESREKRDDNNEKRDDRRDVI